MLRRGGIVDSGSGEAETVGVLQVGKGKSQSSYAGVSEPAGA